MRRSLLCAAVLLLFGLLKLPAERWLTRDLHAAHFLQYQLNLTVREQAGQMGFVAALSGYRAVVADYLWLTAYTAWTRTEWGRMKFLMDGTTSLQPRVPTFWDQAGWHMAWNASVAARENRREPRETLRIKAEREYIAIGENYLQQGVKYNPDSELLYEALGRVHQAKMNDPCGAAHYYEVAATLPGALPYVKRQAAYQLSECPDREREAYAMLLRLYRLSPDERVPTLLKRLDFLQKKLGVPTAEQIDISADLKAATPH